MITSSMVLQYKDHTQLTHIAQKVDILAQDIKFLSDELRKNHSEISTTINTTVADIQQLNIELQQLKQHVSDEVANKISTAFSDIQITSNNLQCETVNDLNADQIDYNLNLTLNKAQKRTVNAALSNTFGFGGHNTSIIVKKFHD